MSIKTGGCPEDCGYCPQSAHYPPGRAVQPLADVATVVAAAKKARAAGATRFCMGAAWRSPPKKDIPLVLEMVSRVKALGLETCATLGMLDAEQTAALKNAGLDYYNHNLDTSPEFYGEIITTRTYDDRLDTLTRVREAGINVCCGGIVGMGETIDDRVSLAFALRELDVESVPVNFLDARDETPLEEQPHLPPLDCLRTLAMFRFVHPDKDVRKRRYKMLVESGVIIQNPDGSREAVSPEEAQKKIAAMDPETRALYEEE